MKNLPDNPFPKRFMSESAEFVSDPEDDNNINSLNKSNFNIYEQRLFDDWVRHGKIVIAVDYDDTLVSGRMNQPELYKEVALLLQKCRYTGAYIVIFTSSSEDRYDEIKYHCDRINVKFDSINTNPVQLPYGDSGKIFYNILLDDRAGLNESMSILNKVLYHYRGYKQNIGYSGLDDIG